MYPALRSFITLFYRGKNHLCPVCETRLRKWVINANGYDLICPKCASIQRKRLLWLYLIREFNITEKPLRMLDFSPSKGVRNKLENTLHDNYFPSCFGKKHEKYQFDITAIPQPDAFFDLIVCYHVLEHIKDDRKAIKELFRTIKPGGWLLAQIPFRPGSTLEEEWINTEELRKQHYGQADHVRFYGKEDFMHRLQSAGFKVEAVEYARKFQEDEIRALGLNVKEVIFVCRK